MLFLSRPENVIKKVQLYRKKGTQSPYVKIRTLITVPETSYQQWCQKLKRKSLLLNLSTKQTIEKKVFLSYLEQQFPSQFPLGN